MAGRVRYTKIVNGQRITLSTEPGEKEPSSNAFARAYLVKRKRGDFKKTPKGQRKADPKPSELEPEFKGVDTPRAARRVRGPVIRPIQPLADASGMPIADPLQAQPSVQMAGGMALAPGGMSFYEMEATDVTPQGLKPHHGLSEPIAEDLGPGAELVTTPRTKVGETPIKQGIDRATSITQPDPESRGSAEETAAQIEPTDEYTLPAHARGVAGEEGELGDDAPRTGPSEVPVAAVGETVFDKGWGQLSEAFEDMGSEIVDVLEETPGLLEQAPEEVPKWLWRATGRNVARLGGATIGAAKDMLWNPVMNLADAYEIDLATGTIEGLKKQLEALREKEEKGVYVGEERAKIDDLLRRALEARKEARQLIAERRMRVLDHIELMQADMNDRYETAGALPAAISFINNFKDDAADIIVGLGHLMLADIPGFEETLYEKGAEGEGFEYVTDYISRSLETGWTKGEEFTVGAVAAPLALLSDIPQAVHTKPVTAAMFLLPAIKKARNRAAVAYANAAKAAPGASVTPHAVRLNLMNKTLEWAEAGLAVADMGLTPLSEGAMAAGFKAPAWAISKTETAARKLPGGETAAKAATTGVDYAKRWIADSLEIPTEKARNYMGRSKILKDEVSSVIYDLANVLRRTVEEDDYVPAEGTSLVPEGAAQAAVEKALREEGVSVDQQLRDEGLMPERVAGATRRQYKTWGPGEIPPLTEWTWADSDSPGSGRRRLSRNHPKFKDEVARVQKALDEGWEQEQAARAAELEAMTPEQRQYEKEKHMARFLQYEGLTKGGDRWALRPPEKEAAEPVPQEALTFEDGSPIPEEPGETISQFPGPEVRPGMIEQEALEGSPQLDLDQLQRETVERSRQRLEQDASPEFRFDFEDRPEWTPQLSGAVRDRYGVYRHEMPEFVRTVDDYLERRYGKGVKFTKATDSKDVSAASVEFFERQGQSAVEAAIRGERYPMSEGEYAQYSASVLNYLMQGKGIKKAQYMALADHLNASGTLNPATGMRWEPNVLSLRLGILDETVDAGVAPRRTVSDFENMRAQAEVISGINEQYPVRPDYLAAEDRVATGTMTRAQQLAIRFAEEGDAALPMAEMVAQLERKTGRRIDEGPVDPTLVKPEDQPAVAPPPGGWYDPETFGIDEGAPTQEGQMAFSFARPAKLSPDAAEAVNTAAKKLNVPAKLLASYFLDALDYNASGKVLNSKILRDELSVKFEEWMDFHNIPDNVRKKLRGDLKAKASSMAKGEYMSTNQAVMVRRPDAPDRNAYFHILPQVQKILDLAVDEKGQPEIWARSLAERVADRVSGDIFKMPVSKKNKALSAAIMKMGFDLADELAGGVQRRQMYQEVMRAPDTASEAILRSREDLRAGGDGVPAVMTVDPGEVSSALVAGSGKRTWSKAGRVRQIDLDDMSSGERAQLLQMYDRDKWVQVDPILLREKGLGFNEDQLANLRAVDENGVPQRQIYMRKAMHDAVIAEVNVAEALNNVGWMDKIVRTAKRSLVPLSLMTTAGNLMSDYMVTVVNEGNPDVWRKVAKVDSMMADIDSGRLTRGDNPELYDKIRRLKWTGLLESTVLDVELGHQVHQGVMDLPVIEMMFGADEGKFTKYHRFKNMLEKQVNEPQLRAFRRGTNAFKAYSALRAWDAMQAAAEGHAVGEKFTMYPMSHQPVVMRRVGDVEGKPTFAIDKTNKVLTPEQWEMSLARNAKVSSDRLFADYSRSGLLVKKLKTMPAANLMATSMFAMYFLHSMWIPGLKRGVAINMFDPNPAFIPTNDLVKKQFENRLMGSNLRAAMMAHGASANQIQSTDWIRSMVGFRRREDAWAALQLTGNPYIMNVWNWGNLDVFQSTRNMMTAIQSGLINFGSSGLELFDQSPDQELSVLYPGGGPGKNIEYKLESFSNPHEKEYVREMRRWKNKDLAGGVYTAKDAMEFMFLGGGPALDLISDIIAAEKSQIPGNWTNIAGKFTNSVIGATAGRFAHVAVGLSDPSSAYGNLRFSVRDPRLFGRRTLDEQDAMKFKWAVRQITMKGWQAQNLKEKGLNRYIKGWARAWQQSVLKPAKDAVEVLRASKDPADKERLKAARDNYKMLKRALNEEKRMLKKQWKAHMTAIKNITEEAKRAPLRVKASISDKQKLKGEKSPGPRANEVQMMNLHNQKRVDAWINQQQTGEEKE